MMKNAGCKKCKNYCALCDWCEKFTKQQYYDPLTGTTQIAGGNCMKLNANGDCIGFEQLSLWNKFVNWLGE